MKSILVLLALLPSIASARTIGTFGQTYPFAERDALHMIEERASQVDWKKIFMESATAARHYRPDIPPIPRAANARKRLVTMSFTLPIDVPDPQDPSRVKYPAGFTFNPLQYMTMPSCVIFVGAADELQAKWLASSQFVKAVATPLLLTSGDISTLEIKLRRPFYYADSTLLEVFGIEAVPSIACQRGDVLEVEEIDVKARR